MEQVTVDRDAVQGGQARLAVGADRPWPPVGDPGASRPGHPALGDDARPARCPAGAQSPGEQALVVAEVGGVEAVGAGRVEHRDALLRRGSDRPERTRVRAIPVGREPHAAEAHA